MDRTQQQIELLEKIQTLQDQAGELFNEIAEEGRYGGLNLIQARTNLRQAFMWLNDAVLGEGTERMGPYT